MICTCLLLVLLLASTYTDITHGKIFNWLVYPGIFLGIVIPTLLWLGGANESMENERFETIFGFIKPSASLLGLLACGGMMVVCYVFFAGQIGGGDVKLIAMIGALMGPYLGLEAMLWTFVIAAAVALIQLTWSVGINRIVASSLQYVIATLRYRTITPLSDAEREPLKTYLYLAPSALIAVVIVRFELLIKI